ncbi:roundabout homolog 3-like [Eriocheir sinensis]|uniref:roundabout homolog 3-like n=1 Tax=Eriocheir sinensis TaxID=95602 RepID=UPI0021C99B94|nr:roundabout homolog 3-like [Eriocheir sinensis]
MFPGGGGGGGGEFADCSRPGVVIVVQTFPGEGAAAVRTSRRGWWRAAVTLFTVDSQAGAGEAVCVMGAARWLGEPMGGCRGVLWSAGGVWRWRELLLLLLPLLLLPDVLADTGFLESIEVQPDTTEAPAVGPELVEAPVNTTVVVGEPAILRCRATGTPPPKLVWHAYRTGRVRTDPARGIAVTDEGLKFESVGKEDEDQYRCTARSTAGPQHSAWVYLKILGKNLDPTPACYLKY